MAAGRGGGGEVGGREGRGRIGGGARAGDDALVEHLARGVDIAVFGALGVELEVERAVGVDGVAVADDEARVGADKVLHGVAAGARDELRGAGLGLGVEVGVERHPALVAVVVAGEHEVDAALDQPAPDGVERRRIALRADAEHGMVEVGDRAGGGVGVEVVDQPLVLGGGGGGLFELAGRVEGDKVPAAGVVAVVVRDVVPVGEVAGGGAVLVLVVADGRVGDVAEEAVEGVGLAVPVIELGEAAFFVDVAQVEDEVGVPAVDHLGDHARRWFRRRRRRPRRP